MAGNMHGIEADGTPDRRLLTINATKAIDMIYDIARGMDYLHDQRVLHNDLKTRNAMVDEADEAVAAESRTHSTMAKVGDLGLMKRLAKGKNWCLTQGGTPVYAAPECMRGVQYQSYPSDVYAFGVLMWTLWFCKCAEMCHHTRQLAYNKAHGYASFKQDCLYSACKGVYTCVRLRSELSSVVAPPPPLRHE